jgi:hypothetical protein
MAQENIASAQSQSMTTGHGKHSEDDNRQKSHSDPLIQAALAMRLSCLLLPLHFYES